MARADVHRTQISMYEGGGVEPQFEVLAPRWGARGYLRLSSSRDRLAGGSPEGGDRAFRRSIFPRSPPGRQPRSHPYKEKRVRQSLTCMLTRDSFENQ